MNKYKDKIEGYYLQGRGKIVTFADYRPFFDFYLEGKSSIALYLVSF